jgi:hypothetical protein
MDNSIATGIALAIKDEFEIIDERGLAIGSSQLLGRVMI